ncbi:MAG: hypothetical protein NC350_01070, partial [Corallococcus sp.]|nr:hypothetical protein [Corallococcus sp.]
TDKDTKVTLTATISYLNRSVTRDFEIIIKKDAPSIGNIFVMVAETGEIIDDGGRIIIDIYRQYAEPAVSVENGAYYNGTLLTNSQYTVQTTYKYALTDSSADKDFAEVNGYNPNVAGVYKITHKVTLAGGDESKEFTYKVYVASTTAQVDFITGASLTVNRDGYIISGALNSVTGSLYSISSATPLTFTADTIKSVDGVKRYDFRDTSVNFQFKNDNSGAYYVYYALANVKGDITSQVYQTQVKVVNIATHEDFAKVAGGTPIGTEVPSETIYMLTKCLDFTGKPYSSGAESFKGLLNGQGHTVSGITVKTTGNSQASVFYGVKGGTIENIKFDNIVLDGGSAQRVGIVGEVRGGYFYNIALTKVSASGGQRVGGLIGQIYEGETATYVDQISIDNPLPEINADGTVKETFQDTLYSIRSSGNRAGGIIGFIQPSGSGLANDLRVYVTNCYSSTYIFCGGYSMGGIVAEYDSTYAATTDKEFRLEIRNCQSSGILVNSGTSRIGGMIGYQQGTGILRISECISIGRHFYKNLEILTCQKNASGIMGNYNINADALVSGCYATMEEHNTNFNVQVYDRNYITGKKTVYGYVKWDMENTWTFVTGKGAMLNFLGDWTCNCDDQPVA